MIDGAALEASNIEMTLGRGASGVQALKGVCLSIAAGQLTLLMGPSGSGKSTLLSIFGCILRQSSGTLRVQGSSTDKMDFEQLAELRRRHFGFVFQSYNLFPGLTALENVRTGLAIRARSMIDAPASARSALEAVGLGHRLQSLPGQLSGGEQQRVAIARAIVAGPSIILADEPTASLDGNAGRSVMEQLQRLSSQDKCAVLVVSHDARALPFADRIITMEDGRILGSANASAEARSPGVPANA
jgi:putative ABC transport system ATP-binding protein